MAPTSKCKRTLSSLGSPKGSLNREGRCQIVWNYAFLLFLESICLWWWYSNCCRNEKVNPQRGGRGSSFRFVNSSQTSCQTCDIRPSTVDEKEVCLPLYGSWNSLSLSCCYCWAESCWCWCWGSVCEIQRCGWRLLVWYLKSRGPNFLLEDCWTTSDLAVDHLL